MVGHPRGDIAVQLLGKEYVLVPTFETMAAIHRATGLGLGELVESLGIRDRGKLRIDVVANVLLQAVLATGETKLTYGEIGEAVVDTLSEPDQPLITAAYGFIIPYFGKKKTDEKKPTKAKA